MDIAKEHSINIEKYEIQNVIVKINQISLYVACSIFIIIGLISLLIPIINEVKNEELWVCITFACFMIPTFLIILLYLIMFKIEYKDDVILYRTFFKTRIINIKDIYKYKVEKMNRTNDYCISIYYLKNRIDYIINSANKENFIFLLNLQQLGIKQIID